MLGHGEYLPWIEANMPIKGSQCSKYVRLAKSRPELLSNGYSSNHLDINSEFKLLALDDNDQSEEIRDTANELDLTRKEVADLTSQVKEKEQTIEEWRQQYLFNIDLLKFRGSKKTKIQPQPIETKIKKTSIMV